MCRIHPARSLANATPKVHFLRRTPLDLVIITTQAADIDAQI